MRFSHGMTLGHGPGPPLPAIQGVPCVQRGIAVSAHIYVHVRVWPPCTFARDTEGSGSFSYALSEGLRGDTTPNDVGVSCRAFTRARLARSGWGFQRALRGLHELELLNACVPHVRRPAPGVQLWLCVRKGSGSLRRGPRGRRDPKRATQ